MSPADTFTKTPVLIAGAGPVGLTLALELGWRGIPCMLVEPNEEFSGNPKAKTVHQRTLELFRRWGRACRTSCGRRRPSAPTSPRPSCTSRA